MTHKTDMREALQLCIDAMLHDGVPTDPYHPRQVALTAAENALACRHDALSVAELAMIREQAAAETDDWAEFQAKEPTKEECDAMFVRKVVALYRPDAQTDEPTAWRPGSETPPVKEGKAQEFILAVRRKHAPEKVFVFAANYANNFTDDGSLSGRDGEDFTAHGWYLCGLDTSGEFDEVYEAITLNEGDEILGWQPLPKWQEVPAAAPAPVSEPSPDSEQVGFIEAAVTKLAADFARIGEAFMDLCSELGCPDNTNMLDWARGRMTCDACYGTGRVFVGNSGRESDGNAPEFERCPSCGYGDAAPSRECVEQQGEALSRRGDVE